MKRHSFTLIELLTVIGIISVLAGMLLPALSKSKETAYGVRCLSNIKQFGSVYQYYSADFNDYLPCLHNLGGEGAAASDGTVLSAKNWLNDLVKYYLGREKASVNPVQVLFCPVEQTTADITTTYGVNYLVATRGIGNGIKTSEFQKTAQTSVLVENYGHLCYYGAALNTAGKHLTGSQYAQNRAANFRHNKQASVCFLDFHADLLKKPEIPCTESYPEKSEDSLKNTWFNSGKKDSSMNSVGNL